MININNISCFNMNKFGLAYEFSHQIVHITLVTLILRILVGLGGFTNLLNRISTLLEGYDNSLSMIRHEKVQ
jgi:hypothetical protein